MKIYENSQFGKLFGGRVCFLAADGPPRRPVDNSDGKQICGEVAKHNDEDINSNL